MTRSKRCARVTSERRSASVELDVLALGSAPGSDSMRTIANVVPLPRATRSSFSTRVSKTAWLHTLSGADCGPTC
jgi:hypothetical protein